MQRLKSILEAHPKRPRYAIWCHQKGIFENNATDTRYHDVIIEARIETKEFIDQLRIVFSTIDIVFSGNCILK